jgi:hypothetical protein
LQKSDRQCREAGRGCPAGFIVSDAVKGLDARFVAAEIDKGLQILAIDRKF